jgi:hypothetical protein|tara:strand:+ start:16 stop:189 length:174 start_codon:yes stop_codon:yes gene_type:complete
MLGAWLLERVLVSCFCFSAVVVARRVWSSLRRSQRESLRDPELGRHSERAFLLSHSQ